VAKSALIIGGTGQIGWACARALSRAGWRVTAASRGTSEVPADLEAEVVTLDRADHSALSAAAEGRDLVLDTIAFTPEDARQLLGLDVGALVVISTASVYLGSNDSYLDVVGDPQSFPDYEGAVDEDWPVVDNGEQTYSPLKAAMERVLLSSELPVTVLRPGAVHGPYSAGLREWFYIKRALDGRSRCVLAYDGQGRFHTSSTTNIAALALACAEQPGRRVLNAVDDESLTDAQIGAAVFEAMGHRAEILHFGGPPRGDLGASPFAVPKPFVVSADRAHREVGYVAPMTYRQSIELDIDWVRRSLAQRPGRDWQEVFPGVLDFGAASWFDYGAEDAFGG
jgi:nucleoside-diphosphate-sugar epimerase